MNVAPAAEGSTDMSPEEILYYRRRIQAERANAASARHIAAAHIHAQLAELYEELLALHKEAPEHFNPDNPDLQSAVGDRLSAFASKLGRQHSQA